MTATQTIETKIAVLEELVALGPSKFAQGMLAGLRMAQAAVDGVAPPARQAPKPYAPKNGAQHWTTRESPEERAVRIAKMQEAKRGKKYTKVGRPAKAPNPPAAAPVLRTAPAENADSAMAHAIAQAVTRNAAVKSHLRKGMDEHEVAARTGAPLREVYRLKAELRTEGGAS